MHKAYRRTGQYVALQTVRYKRSYEPQDLTLWLDAVKGLAVNKFILEDQGGTTPTCEDVEHIVEALPTLTIMHIETNDQINTGIDDAGIVAIIDVSCLA